MCHQRMNLFVQVIFTWGPMFQANESQLFNCASVLSVFCTHLHLSCNGSRQRRPTPLPSWSQSLGTACSSGSGRKAVSNVTPPSATSRTCRTLPKHHPPIKVVFDTFSDVTESYFCCHDEAGGGGVDGDITSHQSHILELLVHLSVLLVGEGLDGAGEDHSLLLSEGQCDGIPTRGRYKSEHFRIRSLKCNWKTNVNKTSIVTSCLLKILTRHRRSCQQRCVQTQVQTGCCQYIGWPRAGTDQE